MEKKKIIIIGAGIMGTGIAEIAARSGMAIELYDKDKDTLNIAIDKIEKSLQIAIDKKLVQSKDKNAILSRITRKYSIEELSKNCDFVIETIPEILSAKKEVFKSLDKKFDINTIIGTNTSSLSVTEIASATDNPSRVIGMHFFNPVQIIDLVEIIRGNWTTEVVFLESKNFVEELGKTAIEIKDSPGFIVNRLLIPMINEAVFILSENIASKEDIDLSMQIGTRHPIGPLALADLIGLDVCLNIMNILYKEFLDPKYRPAPLLIKMVRAGLLGRKAKKGFYIYE